MHFIIYYIYLILRELLSDHLRAKNFKQRYSFLQSITNTSTDTWYLYCTAFFSQLQTRVQTPDICIVQLSSVHYKHEYRHLISVLYSFIQSITNTSTYTSDTCTVQLSSGNYIHKYTILYLILSMTSTIPDFLLSIPYVQNNKTFS